MQRAACESRESSHLSRHSGCSQWYVTTVMPPGRRHRQVALQLAGLLVHALQRNGRGSFSGLKFGVSSSYHTMCATRACGTPCSALALPGKTALCRWSPDAVQPS